MIEKIKKLLMSSIKEDRHIAMIYLAKHIKENGIENLNPSFYGVEGALELLDLTHPKTEEWALVIIRDKFAINLAGSGSKRAVIYRQPGHVFYNNCLEYKDKIIYEE